ncbi:MAG: UbiA family prenyltransferase [Holophaga sp.]|jgi:protoheme IX farnesyltransferase
MTWRDFNQLTKVSISAASTLTAAAGYLAGLRAFHWGLLTTLLGTLLMALGSCAWNEVQECGHDARMVRTRNRPLPSGRVARRTGFLLGAALSVSGFAVLLLHGWAPALLGLLALAWYNGVYTPLKRVTAFAIIPGALIGALPPAIGWAAAGADLRAPALLALCLLFFLWQVPHFWMLMLLHDQDYGRAQFPTLSRHFRPDQSARLTFTWMAATAFSCAFLPAFGAVFSLPVLAALALAALWLVWRAAALLQGPLDGRTLRATFWSINLFALVMILAVSADPFLPCPPSRVATMAQRVP